MMSAPCHLRYRRKVHCHQIQTWSFPLYRRMSLNSGFQWKCMEFYNIYIFKGCFLEMTVYLCSETEIHSSVAATYIKCTRFIPLTILKVFTQQFVHTSFIAWFISYFIPKNMVKIDFFYGCWHYFLIYGLIKKDVKNPLYENLSL